MTTTIDLHHIYTKVLYSSDLTAENPSANGPQKLWPPGPTQIVGPTKHDSLWNLHASSSDGHHTRIIVQAKWKENKNKKQLYSIAIVPVHLWRDCSIDELVLHLLENILVLSAPYRKS